MSAYIVEKNVVLFLVAAMQTRSIGHGSFSWYHGGNTRSLGCTDTEAAADVANLLWRENMRSVSARYPNESSGTLPGGGDNEAVTAADFQHCFDRIEPVQVLKACDCFAYQSCESDDWEETEVFSIVEALRSRAISALPGYDDAIWGAPQINRGVISLSALAGQRGRR